MSVVVENLTSPEAPSAWARGEIVKTDHLAIRVPDIERAAAWYSAVLGLRDGGRANGRAYLTAPVSGKITVALSAGGTGLEHVSLLVKDDKALARIRQRIADAGIAVTDSSRDARPGATAAFRIQLPTDQGVEFMVAPSVEEPFGGARRPELGAFNIVASHVQLRTPDVGGLTEFFKKIGFRLTEFGKAPGSERPFAAFVRANEFHHQFALFDGRVGLHHIALEIEEVDFLKIGDHFARLGIKAEYGPGRHKPGQSIFIYVLDPFGNRIEITSPMEMVGHEQAPTRLTDPFPFLVNMWGPQPPESWMKDWT
jgi:catechol 2,3-dioxygenase